MEEEKVIVQVDKALPKSETKVVFGALNKPTPIEAKWVFRGTLIVTSVVAFWIGGTKLVEESNKLEIVQALKALDLLVFGFSKMFGIVPNDEENV